MTPTERAEKIAKEIYKLEGFHVAEIHGLIAIALRDMERDAFAEGFNAARETAKGIVETADAAWEEYLERNAGVRILIPFEKFIAQRIGNINVNDQREWGQPIEDSK